MYLSKKGVLKTSRVNAKLVVWVETRHFTAYTISKMPL